MSKGRSINDLVCKEKRLVCPYNPSHLVDPLRMARHLVKCKKSFPDLEMVVCPFNAIHHVRKEELQSHIKECDDKSIVEKAVFFRKNPHVLQTMYPFDSSDNGDFSPPSGLTRREDWELEIKHSISYDPEKRVLNKQVSRIPPSNLGKAGKKLWREVDCERVRRLRECLPIKDLVYPTADGRGISIREIEDGPDAELNGREKVMKPVELFSSTVLPKPNPIMKGDQPVRRPRIHTNRIAANIFGEDVTTPSLVNNEKPPCLQDQKASGAIKKTKNGTIDLLSSVEMNLAALRMEPNKGIATENHFTKNSENPNTRDMSTARRMIFASLASSQHL